MVWGGWEVVRLVGGAVSGVRLSFEGWKLVMMRELGGWGSWGNRNG